MKETISVITTWTIWNNWPQLVPAMVMVVIATLVAIEVRNALR